MVKSQNVIKHLCTIEYADLSALFSFSMFNRARFSSCLTFRICDTQSASLHLCCLQKSTALITDCSNVKDFPIFCKLKTHFYTRTYRIPCKKTKYNEHGNADFDQFLTSGSHIFIKLIFAEPNIGGFHCLILLIEMR